MRSGEEALDMYPIGTEVRRTAHDGIGERVGNGKVYEYLDPYWRVIYPNGSWLEFSSREMSNIAIHRKRP